MSALAYGADGADAGGSVSVHVASGGQEHTKDRGHRTHAGPHSRPELTANMTGIAEKVRPGEPNGSGIVPLVLAEIRARTPLPLSVANYSDETVRLYRVHDAAGPSW